ncbi:DUF2691 family protein [Paenibacillus sp. USDA918EY]|uniref:DUF2691 family protein n=1 Tax=Paenibacillus sp. USDA918EY TaxID=2689575 RepID=UPI00135CECF7|nr:DUF2691 family protein [Paenibacillus sp. USDA918EY]
MKRGITLKIPNEYGSFLSELLEPLEVSQYDWRIGGEESYLINDGDLEPLFPDNVEAVDGALFNNIIRKTYYLIFADFKAFPKGKKVIHVETYEEFLNSECYLVLLVVDSVYITIYCKNDNEIDILYNNAIEKGFIHVRLITDENDSRTKLSVW